jgi:hypothetical protein
MMFKSSLLVLLGAAVLAQTYSAKLTSDTPVMIALTGKSATDSAECKEQFVSRHS